MPEYVLFDLDGTLTDPGEGITNSVMYALGKYGITVKRREELYKFIGPPLADSFMNYYGFSREQSEEAIKFYREYFKDRGIFENKVYPGVPEMLSRLKNDGFKPVLATSKPEEFAKIILTHFGLDSFFEAVAGASMNGSRCRKADVIARALSLTGASPDSAVMVGDREHDALGAKEAGLRCVGVLYGYGSEAELKKAGVCAVAATPDEVYEIIKNM